MVIWHKALCIYDSIIYLTPTLVLHSTTFCLSFSVVQLCLSARPSDDVGHNPGKFFLLSEYFLSFSLSLLFSSVYQLFDLSSVRVSKVSRDEVLWEIFSWSQRIITFTIPVLSDIIASASAMGLMYINTIFRQFWGWPRDFTSTYKRFFFCCHCILCLFCLG